ncbi:MAG: transposase, partial [Maribacter sp.]
KAQSGCHALPTGGLAGQICRGVRPAMNVCVPQAPKGAFISSRLPRNPCLVEDWINYAIETELVEMVRFARVLHRDIEAVKNAVKLPWSNGQAEGQINRLKTLKRSMYGRAWHELMRARMLPRNHTL